MREVNWDDVTEGTERGIGLLPVVVQDDRTGYVLMLIYMDREALQISRDTRVLTAFSRKTQALRVQGESRGCCLDIVDMQVNCEGTSLLVTVIPRGNPVNACHEHRKSCFDS